MDGPNRGRITSGIEPNTLLTRTTEFVYRQLADWREDPERPEEAAEEKLNAQLCKFLNARSRRSLKMAYFFHEERQTGTRRVDMAALPTEGTIIGSTYFSHYDPFLVMEGKRLPAPEASREREYLTGGSAKSGGVQRFRLGLHGAALPRAILIGYIQDGHPREWFDRINGWVDDLVTAGEVDGESWAAAERLTAFTEARGKNVARSASRHPRQGPVVSPLIDLDHFWIRMARKDAVAN
ncbi:MAG: hypothetical protein EXS37_19750 [Opitutus sp.]|nr:hypothetical protein [Opitutus sp.]